MDNPQDANVLTKEQVKRRKWADYIKGYRLRKKQENLQRDETVIKMIREFEVTITRLQEEKQQLQHTLRELQQKHKALQVSYIKDTR